MGLRRRLTETAVEIPSVAAERCVHSRVEVASCTRCIAACPHQAWVLDEEELALDTGLCDGCGLCVAHCPEGALSQQDSALPLLSARNTIDISCHRRAEDGAAYRVSCINAISLRQITSLYRRGLRKLVLQTDDCTTCEYRDEQGLLDQIDAFNQVLAQRGLHPLDVIWTPGRGRQPSRPEAAHDSEGPGLSRRGFLRHLAGALAETAHGAEEAVFEAPGTWLPEACIGDLALYVPHIDPQRCNGCDTCTRICSSGALALGPDGDAYHVRADRCTGCGLCVDVCDRDAVSVGERGLVDQLRVPLRGGVCRACGALFHRPTAAAGSDTLCQICEHVNHRRHLYQVLE